MTSLEKLRKEIDDIDKKIIVEFFKRKKVVEKIAKFKKDNNIAIEHLDRERIVIQNAVELGTKHDLRLKFLEELFKLIIKESKRIQEEK